MKKFTKVLVMMLLCVALAVVAIACNNAQPATPTADPPTITNKPANNKLTITDDADTYQFQIGDYAGSVTWTSTVKGVAEISSSGLLTMKAAGVTIVIVKDTTTQLSDSVSLTIEDERTTPAPPVTNAPTIANKPADNKLAITDAEDTYQFRINDYDGAVTWISTEPSIAEISQSGLLTMKQEGTTEVIVQDASDAQLYDSVTLTIEDERRQYTLAIEGMPEGAIRVGHSDITLSAKDVATSDPITVIWHSNNDSVATINENTGVMQIIGKGTATITATKADDANVKKTLTVSVLGMAPTEIAFDSVPKYGMLQKNNYTLGVTVGPQANATLLDDYAIEWSVDDEDVATVDNDGNVEALTAGKVKIKAKVTGEGITDDVSCEKELTVYASDPTQTDFRFAQIDGNLVKGTGLKGIGLTATQGEIVDLGDDAQNMALKITTEEGGPYNNVEFNFGEHEAGSYKIMIRFVVQSGEHNGAIAVPGKDPYATLPAMSYSGNHTYSFIFYHAAAGDLIFRLVNSAYKASVAIIDDVSIAPFTASTDALGSEVTFDESTDLAANGIHSLYGGELDVKSGELTVQNGSVALFVGDVVKGRYNLKLDITTAGGHPAIAKLVHTAGVDEKSGVFWGADVVTLGGTEMGLTALARKTGEKTYTLSFNFENDYASVAILLIDNSEEKSGTLTIDNLSFAKETYSQKVTIADFENGVIDKGTWNQKGKLAYSVCAYMDANTVDNVGTVMDNTENTDTLGNKVYKKQSASHYTRISFGWLEAGTYEVTVMVKVSKAVNGQYFGVRSLLEEGTGLSNQNDQYFNVTINANAWTPVTLSFTLAQKYYIKCGFASAANDGVIADANASFYFDNFTLQKTA